MVAAGRFARGFLYNEALFGTAKAGCYRGVQTDLKSVGTALT